MYEPSQALQVQIQQLFDRKKRCRWFWQMISHDKKSLSKNRFVVKFLMSYSNRIRSFVIRDTGSLSFSALLCCPTWNQILTQLLILIHDSALKTAKYFAHTYNSFPRELLESFNHMYLDFSKSSKSFHAVWHFTMNFHLEMIKNFCISCCIW